MFSSKMYIPNEKLKDWIKVFWFLEGNSNQGLTYTRNILPDGCATITFVIQGNMDLTIYKNGKIKRGIYIIPPVVNAHYDLISDDIFLIDIQLNPSIFYKLFNLPVNQLENRIYTFDELSLNFDKSILEKIYEVKNNKNINNANQHPHVAFYLRFQNDIPYLSVRHDLTYENGIIANHIISQAALFENRVYDTVVDILRSRILKET